MVIRTSLKCLVLASVVGGLVLVQVGGAFAAGSNLVTNPRFAEGTTGWNAGTGDTLVVVPGGHHTPHAGEVSNSDAGANVCLLSDNPDTVSDATAGTYRSSIWLRGPTGAAIFSLKEHNPSHTTVVGEAKARLVLTRKWRKVSLSYTVADPGDTLGISVVEGTAPPGLCFLADDASMAVENSP